MIICPICFFLVVHNNLMWFWVGWISYHFHLSPWSFSWLLVSKYLTVLIKNACKQIMANAWKIWAKERLLKLGFVIKAVRRYVCLIVNHSNSFSWVSLEYGNQDLLGFQGTAFGAWVFVIFFLASCLNEYLFMHRLATSWGRGGSVLCQTFLEKTDNLPWPFITYKWNNWSWLEQRVFFFSSKKKRKIIIQQVILRNSEFLFLSCISYEILAVLWLNEAGYGISLLLIWYNNASEYALYFYMR